MKFFFFALHRAATRIGSNVRGSVHTLTDKSMALWDKVRKRLGNSENSAGCSCGREYPNSEGVFYEDYFTRWAGRVIVGWSLQKLRFLGFLVTTGGDTRLLTTSRVVLNIWKRFGRSLKIVSPLLIDEGPAVARCEIEFDFGTVQTVKTKRKFNLFYRVLRHFPLTSIKIARSLASWTEAFPWA